MCRKLKRKEIKIPNTNKKAKNGGKNRDCEECFRIVSVEPCTNSLPHATLVDCLECSNGPMNSLLKMQKYF